MPTFTKATENGNIGTCAGHPNLKSFMDLMPRQNEILLYSIAKLESALFTPQ